MELIKDKEDREFTTSTGHWEGDGVWVEDEDPNHAGCLSLELPLIPGIAQIELKYPNITVKPGKIHQFSLDSKVIKTEYPFLGIQVWITDGTYNELLFAFSNPPNYEWQPYPFDIEIPDDWNKEETKLTIKGNAPEFAEDPDLIKLDNFTLIVGGIQYLPIVGAG